MMDLDRHVARIVGGDPEAFGLWAASAEPSLRAALRPFAARLDSEAVLQEALLRIWQVAPRFTPDGKPNGLLRLGLRITSNLALSEVRRTHASPTEAAALERAISDAGGHIAPSEPDPHLREAISHCRERLPPKPAQALAQRLDHPATPDAALAEALGMRLNTFLQNFTRARKLLAECLRKRGIRLAEEL